MERLDVFSIEGVKEEWARWFDVQEAKIRSTMARSDRLWFQWALPMPLQASMPRAPVAPLPPLVPPAPFGYDPVTHVGLTAAQQRQFQAQMRCLPNLLPGGLTLLRLQFGAAVPRTHVLPWCLGVLPVNFVLSDISDFGLVEFDATYTSRAERSLKCIWVQQGKITMPLSSVLVSGIELTTSKKLTVKSQEKISSSVSTFDLSLS